MGPLEKETAAYSSVLTWKIPGAEEPGRLQSMGSQRARHDSTEGLWGPPGLSAAEPPLSGKSTVASHFSRPNLGGGAGTMGP